MDPRMAQALVKLDARMRPLEQAVEELAIDVVMLRSMVDRLADEIGALDTSTKRRSFAWPGS